MIAVTPANSSDEFISDYAIAENLVIRRSSNFDELNSRNAGDSLKIHNNIKAFSKIIDEYRGNIVTNTITTRTIEIYSDELDLFFFLRSAASWKIAGYIDPFTDYSKKNYFIGIRDIFATMTKNAVSTLKNTGNKIFNELINSVR